MTDLKERGLDKHVAVLMWGEMGRTPKINTNPGRDHWADSGFAFFAGGAGLEMGQVIGQTDARGDEMEVDGLGAEGDHACDACGKQVCFHCSVSNLGEQRRCLSCAGRKVWIGGIGWAQVGVPVY